MLMKKWQRIESSTESEQESDGDKEALTSDEDIEDSPTLDEPGPQEY